MVYLSNKKKDETRDVLKFWIESFYDEDNNKIHKSTSLWILHSLEVTYLTLTPFLFEFLLREE